MNAWPFVRPTLTFIPIGSDLGPPGIEVDGLDRDTMRALARYVGGGGLLETILRVRVERAGDLEVANLPDILGRHAVSEDGVRFEPCFPFQPGLTYRAIYDPRPLDHPALAEVLSFKFAIPAAQNAPSSAVEHIFPSYSSVPENLLRFHVCFSTPMQRGRVQAEIAVLDRDGMQVHDVLYRAPVELWDPSMRFLTVLLDPGRLKRGVGPNRELGPPLKAGREYALAVGKGMTGISGQQLPEGVLKRFRVTEAVRGAVDPGQWDVLPPSTGSRHALVVAVPRPLDWALLLHSVSVETASGQPVKGRVSVGRCETEWSFAPEAPWEAGGYRVCVAPEIEDVCGNSVTAAFDRALPAAGDQPDHVQPKMIDFNLA